MHSRHATGPLRPPAPAATSRFSRDRISDKELARLLRWWQNSERSAADINGDGLVDAAEAALQVAGMEEGCAHRATPWARRSGQQVALCKLKCFPSSLHHITPTTSIHIQEQSHPKLLRVQGRVVTEANLTSILQVQE